MKFNYSQDKVTVKQKAYSVFDIRTLHTRYQTRTLKLIQDPRRTLIPALIGAKQQGKAAYLSCDKLFINGQEFSADNVDKIASN